MATHPTYVVTLSPDLQDALTFAAERLELATPALIREAVVRHLATLDLPVSLQVEDDLAAVVKVRRRASPRARRPTGSKIRAEKKLKKRKNERSRRVSKRR